MYTRTAYSLLCLKRPERILFKESRPAAKFSLVFISKIRRFQKSLIQYTDTYSADVAAKIGDWVICVQEKCCYERVDSGWRLLPIYESGKYMIALKDMCESAPNAAFTAAFVKDLFAQTVNTEAVNVLMKLMVGEGNNGILIDGMDKLIKSMNYSATAKTEWMIDYLGNVFFNNGIFHRRVEADSGLFGPMQILNDDVSKPTVLTFIIGQTWIDVSTFLFSNAPEGQFISGTYMGKTIKKIDAEVIAPNAWVIFTYSDNTTQRLNVLTPFASTLTLTYQFVGKKITIQNIPTSTPSQPNCLWRDSSGYLRIT